MAVTQKIVVELSHEDRSLLRKVARALEGIEKNGRPLDISTQYSTIRPSSQDETQEEGPQQ